MQRKINAKNNEYTLTKKHEKDEKHSKNIRKTPILALKIEILLDEMKSLYRNHRKQIKVFFQRKYLKQTVSVDQSSAHRKNLV